MTIAEKAPDYRCTFAGTGLLSAYAWTGTGDIRPGTAQWAKSTDSSGYTGNISVNGQAYGSSAGDGYAMYHLDIGAQAKKIVCNLKNTGTDVGDGVSIYLRTTGTQITGFDYISVSLFIDTGPQKKLSIFDGVQAPVEINITTDFNTILQTLTIIDTGTEIVAQIGSFIVSLATSEGAGATSIAIEGHDPATTCVWDNLEVWI